MKPVKDMTREELLMVSVERMQNMTQEELRIVMNPPQPTFEEMAREWEEDIKADPGMYIMSSKRRGSQYLEKNNFERAARYFKEGLEIAEKQPTTSRGYYSDIADFCGSLGVTFGRQGDRSNQFMYLTRAIKIREEHDPGGLQLGIYYGNIAVYYRDTGNLELALQFYQKYLKIKQEKLPLEDHKELVYGFYHTARVARDLKKYDLALSYVNTSIQKDPSYKYSYHLKGLILQEQALSLQGQAKKDALEQSLASCKKAVELDPEYGDAKIDQLRTEALLLGLEKDKLKRASKVQALRLEVSTAKTQKKPDDYDQKKRLELQKASKDGMRAEIPETEFEIGSPRYKKALDNVLEQVSALEARTSATEARVDAVETRVSSLESRMDILEKKVYTLSDAMAMCERSISDVDQRITDAKQLSSLPSSSTEHKSSNSSSNTNHLLADLLIERAKLEERKSQIKSFHDNVGLRHFYFALLSELEAAYIAAQAMQSGQLSINKSTKFTTPAKYIATAISLAPIAGHLAATLIKGAGNVIDSYETVKTTEEFLRIRNIAATIEDFDRFALRVSVDLTLARQEEIMILEGKKVPEDWKKIVKSLLKGGLEKAMAEFIKTNDTEAKLRGRVAANQVINYLQQDGIAEGLSYTDAIDIGKPTFKTSHSVAAMKVVKKIISPDPVEPSKSVENVQNSVSI